VQRAQSGLNEVRMWSWVSPVLSIALQIIRLSQRTYRTEQSLWRSQCSKTNC